MTDRVVDLGPGRRPALGPAGVLPAVPPDDRRRRRGRRRTRAAAAQALGQRPGAGQVEPGQRQAGVQGVHVGVDEAGDHQRTGEVDHPIGPSGVVDRVLAAEPADGAVGDGQRGGLGVGGGVHPAVAQNCERHR